MTALKSKNRLSKGKASGDSLIRSAAYETSLEKAETPKTDDANFRLLFDASPDPIWVYSKETLRFLEVNQAALDRYGYSRDEFLTLSIADIRPAEDIPRLISTMRQVHAGIKNVGEWRHLCKNGEIIIAEVRSRDIRFGDTECRLAIAHDVTERKLQEKRLQLSEERYRQIVETANEGIWTSDVEGRAIFVNQKMAEMLGYRPDEIIGHKAIDFAHEDFISSLEAGLKRRHQGVSEQYVTRLRRRDGSDFWAQISASPILDVEGNFSATLAMVTDITEHRLFEERIRFQAHLLDMVGQAVIATDLKGEVLYWNRYAESLYGWSSQEAMGINISSLVVPESQHHYAEEIMGKLKQGETWSSEFIVQRRNGTPFPAQVTNSPIHDTDGTLIGIVGISVDLTAQKRLQDQLAQKEKLASIGELIAGVAHEINNPLAVISGQAQLLQLHPDDQVQVDAQCIRDMASRASRIMNSLRSYARPSDGTVSARSLLSDLNQVVNSSLDVIAYKLRNSEITITTEFFAALPFIPINPGEIEQVIVNILSNAEHALRQRTAEYRHVHIQTRFDSDLKATVLSIQDTGCGMSDEVRSRIFDPFFSTKDREEGTGLGLYISHSIVMAHGGAIFVDSIEGIGTTFTLSLPMEGA